MEEEKIERHLIPSMSVPMTYICCLKRRYKRDDITIENPDGNYGRHSSKLLLNVPFVCENKEVISYCVGIPFTSSWSYTNASLL